MARQKHSRQIKLAYWFAGWVAIFRHPIRVPRDWARAADMLEGDVERVRL